MRIFVLSLSFLLISICWTATIGKDIAFAGGWASASNGRYFKLPEKQEPPLNEEKTTNTPSPSGNNQLLIRYYHVIAEHIYRTCPYKGGEWADGVARAIIASCIRENVDPLLATALFTQESRFDNDVVSPTGAIGISQLMPGTASALGVHPENPEENIEGGVAYLGSQLRRFSNSGEWRASFAIAAYNAGPNAVLTYGGIPPYPETINHVRIVGDNYQQLLARFQQLQ